MAGAARLRELLAALEARLALPKLSADERATLEVHAAELRAELAGPKKAAAGAAAAPAEVAAE